MAPSGVASVKSPEAFRTISEVADMLDVPQHVLRFWETRFPQIKPVKRAGGRRFYRPEDVDLLRGIQLLLYYEGYTIRGAQKILREKGVRYTASLGRELRQNGHVLTQPQLAVPIIEGDDAEALAPIAKVEGREADALASLVEVEGREAETPAAEFEPMPFAPPEAAVAVESAPAENSRRTRLEAIRAELAELKIRLGAARGRTTL
jgi:DNA-binding transcriptional MerR regulator